MRRSFGIGVLAAGLLVGATLAQDGPVTIKLKKAGPGVVTRETKSEKAENKVLITVMGMEQAKNESGTTKFVYTDEVIEKPAGSKRATKLKRSYETAELKTKEGDEELGLAGKTILIEKKGDRYEFTAGGQAITGKAAEILGKEFNKKTDTDEEAFLPKKPVRVGETWKPDLPELTKELAAEGMTIDVAKSSASATLKKVYKKGDVTFGVIEVELALAVSKVGGEGMAITLNDGSKLNIKVELDGCIDGTLATGSSKMSMTGNMSGEVMGVALKIALTATNAGTSEEVKK